MVPIEERLWLKFTGQKYIKSPVGKNKLMKIASIVAQYLKLDNYQEYTSHSFRTSFVTSLVNKNISRENIKRIGGWKSDTILEGYFHDSEKFHNNIAFTLSNSINSSNNPQNHIFNSCQIQIVIIKSINK